jgi:putative pyruvate formate lyase activating enzyme
MGKTLRNQGRRAMGPVDALTCGFYHSSVMRHDMDDFARLWVWQDKALRRALGWYFDVAGNRKPAKFRIARSIPVGLALAETTEEGLWAEFARLTPVFIERWAELRASSAPLPPAPAEESLLDLCAELAARMLTHCNFCRWNCRVDRTQARKIGACKLAAEARVSSYFHHPGEELIYRGVEGSGTIFFTSCNMRCAFCQNGDISTDKDQGRIADPRALATMAWQLRREGCHNVNWVGGEVTIHLHAIAAAIALLGRGFVPRPDDLQRARPVKSDGLAWYDLAPEAAGRDGAFNAPMLWNSNFFMSGQAMAILRLLIDVWLPDFKFGPGRCAIALSRTPRYWETVTENLRLIHDWGEDFTIRHLVMPGHVECCTYPILDWIAENTPQAPVNIMDQFHPDNFCDARSAKYDPRFAGIARRPNRAELGASYRYARRLGIMFEILSFEKNALGLYA